jgi:hypothetical protein
MPEYFYGFDNQAIPHSWETVLDVCIANATDPFSHVFAMHFMALEVI